MVISARRHLRVYKSHNKFSAEPSLFPHEDCDCSDVGTYSIGICVPNPSGRGSECSHAHTSSIDTGDSSQPLSMHSIIPSPALPGDKPHLVAPITCCASPCTGWTAYISKFPF